MGSVLISGGGLKNKGAQAMLFIAVDEVKKRLPNHKIWVLSNSDYFKRRCSLDLDFEIIPDIFRYKFGYGLYAKREKISRKEIIRANKILKSASVLVDVSGYALSSDFRIINQLFYLSKILWARKYNIKVYLMPQSFGPFEYNTRLRWFMRWRIEKCLSYCEHIFAREKEGYDYLTRMFRLKNVEQTPDLVLLNQGINFLNVFTTVPLLQEIDIKKNSVGVVPNIRTIQYGCREYSVGFYVAAINALLTRGITAYLLRHSNEDLELCKIIKEKFKNNSNVILLNEDFNSIEFNNIVKKFKFIIASRYHSIVHAYKNSVPAIIFGWATKYHELAELFDQCDYIFDVRKGFTPANFSKTIDSMILNFKDEKLKIKASLSKLQARNVFDVVTGV